MEDLAWQTTREDVQDQAHWKHWMEALEWEQLDLLRQQGPKQAQTVDIVDNDHWTLDTVLGLVVMCMPLTAQPLSLAPQSLWFPPASSQQTLSGPRRRSSVTSHLLESLAQPPPCIPCYLPGPSPTTYPMAMCPKSRRCQA